MLLFVSPGAFRGSTTPKSRISAAAADWHSRLTDDNESFVTPRPQRRWKWGGDEDPAEGSPREGHFGCFLVNDRHAVVLMTDDQRPQRVRWGWFWFGEFHAQDLPSGRVSPQEHPRYRVVQELRSVAATWGKDFGKKSVGLIGTGYTPCHCVGVTAQVWA